MLDPDFFPLLFFCRVGSGKSLFRPTTLALKLEVLCPETFFVKNINPMYRLLLRFNGKKKCICPSFCIRVKFCSLSFVAPDSVPGCFTAPVTSPTNMLTKK